MKILQLGYKMPYPLKDGGSVALYQMSMCMLEAGFSVKLFCVNTPKSKVSYPTEDLKEFLKQVQFKYGWVDTRIKMFPMFFNLFSKTPYFISRFYDRKFEKKIIEILQGEKFDLVVAEHLSMCKYFPAIKKNSSAKFVLRAQNIEHKLWQSVIHKTSNPLRRFYLAFNNWKLQRFELDILKKVDGIMAISNEDESFCKQVVSSTPVVHIPITVSINQDELKKVKHATFYHLGSMDWTPNLQGVDWFIKEVLPLMATRFDDFILHIAGKKMPSKYRNLAHKNLQVEGEIELASEYLADKSVLIVPLWSGGGVKAKVLEAMSLGKLVISTQCGVQGIPCRHNYDVLIANNPQEFCDQISRCIVNPAMIRVMGERARETIRNHFERKVAGKNVESFLSSLLN